MLTFTSKTNDRPAIWLKSKDADGFALFFMPAANAYADDEAAWDNLNDIADQLNMAGGDDRMFVVSNSKPRLYVWRDAALRRV